jgi:hypothetical protein
MSHNSETASNVKKEIPRGTTKLGTFTLYPIILFIFSIANPMYLTANKGNNVIQITIPNKMEALSFNFETMIESNHITTENKQAKTNVPIPPQR